MRLQLLICVTLGKSLTSLGLTLLLVKEPFCIRRVFLWSPPHFQCLVLVYWHMIVKCRILQLSLGQTIRTCFPVSVDLVKCALLYSDGENTILEENLTII